MPRKETFPVEGRKTFVESWRRADLTFERLREQFGVPRKTTRAMRSR